MQDDPKLERHQACGLFCRFISSSWAKQQQNKQAAEFLLTRRFAAGLFKTLIMAPLPMWQLKDCPTVIIAPINKAKATICFPAPNTIYHLTNDCKGNIWCHAANYWLPFTNIGFTAGVFVLLIPTLWRALREKKKKNTLQFPPAWWMIL